MSRHHPAFDALLVTRAQRHGCRVNAALAIPVLCVSRIGKLGSSSRGYGHQAKGKAAD